MQGRAESGRRSVRCTIHIAGIEDSTEGIGGSGQTHEHRGSKSVDHIAGKKIQEDL